MKTERKQVVIGVMGLVIAVLLAFVGAGCSNSSAPAPSVELILSEPGTQTTCPIMGSKIDRELYVDSGGRRIYVCCKGCQSSVARDFDGAARKVESNGETVATLGK